MFSSIMPLVIEARMLEKLYSSTVESSVAVVELGLRSMLSIAAVVKCPCRKLGGHTTLSQ